MTEVRPVYLSLWRRPKPVFGYWSLRHVRGQYRCGIKLPDRPMRVYAFDNPSEAVQTFCASYTAYHSHQLETLWAAQLTLPAREYVRQGFRAGWLLRLRQEMERQYQQALRFVRHDLPQRLQALRDGNWPTPTHLPVPWENVDAPTAAESLWLPQRGFSLDVLAPACDQQRTVPAEIQPPVLRDDCQATGPSLAGGSSVLPRPSPAGVPSRWTGAPVAGPGNYGPPVGGSGVLQVIVPSLWNIAVADSRDCQAVDAPATGAEESPASPGSGDPAAEPAEDAEEEAPGSRWSSG